MSSSVVKPVYVPKVESSPVGDMSAYYSDDNSDDDFKMPTKKRTKVSIVYFSFTLSFVMFNISFDCYTDF
jgi:hypothetical protein